MANLPLVHYVLRRFRDRWAEYEDLYQYGCLGLLKAVDRFEPQYNLRFSTYAVPVIMGEIRRFLRDDGAIHVSRTIHDHAQLIGRFREQYLSSHETEPTIEEIVRETKLDKEDVLLALNANCRVRSLFEPVGGDGEQRLMDVIGKECISQVDSRLTLVKLLQELEPRERALIVRRYFKSHTQSAIAKDMGISQVQVSRLEKRILRNLRKQVEDG